MELLETHGSKGELLRKSARQKAALEEEVKLLSERTERILTNALIVGGVLSLSYLLYKGFSGKSKKKKKAARHTAVATAEPHAQEESSGASSVLAGVGGVLASQAISILLSIAKEKLVEYLQSQEKQKADEHS
jgi:hypothetical protein